MTVHFVGAGPGAADLLTLRAATLLAEADVVLYPGTYLDEGFLVHVSPDAELVDTQDLDLDQIMARLVEASRTGSRWCGSSRATRRSTPHSPSRPTGSTQAGVAWDVTPGVPAYAAAAALVGRELTVPLVAQSVVLTRAQARSTAMPSGEALANFAATGATLVVHLAITRTRELMDELAGHYGADCPVVVVHRASQPGELVLRGTVADIAEQVELAGLRQAAVILVGRALDPDDPAQSFLYDPARDRSTKRPS